MKSLTSTIVVCVSVLFLFGGFLLYRFSFPSSNSGSSVSAVKKASPEIAQQDSTPPVSACNLGWRFVQNNAYNYSLCIPADWTTSQNVDNGELLAYPPSGLGTDPNDGTHLDVRPTGTGRESVFDVGAGVTIVRGMLNGVDAAFYGCPSLNPCPRQILSEKDVRIINPPAPWNAGNEIQVVGGADFPINVSVLDQVLYSFSVRL
jgi:hypothetical protein